MSQISRFLFFINFCNYELIKGNYVIGIQNLKSLNYFNWQLSKFYVEHLNVFEEDL